MKKILILLIGFLTSCVFDYQKSPVDNYSGCIVVHTWTGIRSSQTVNVTVKKKGEEGDWCYINFNTFKSEFKYNINDTIK